MYHYRKTFKKYLAKNAKTAAQLGCTFCIKETRDQQLSETKHCYLIQNRVQYDLWENHPVTEHLMVIPKRHVENLSEMTPEERLDMMNVAAEYETKGYNVYARGVGSPRRTVAHQHTHLIKIEGKLPRLMVRVNKPYFLFRI